MNLEDIMLSEISQTQKDKYHMTPLAGGPYSPQTRRSRKQKGVWWGLGEGWGVRV